MTDLEKYTVPGILEDFCLGLLPDETNKEIILASKQLPELLQKIIEMEQSLIQYSTVDSSANLKEKIIAGLDHLTADIKIDISNPPPINRNSDLNGWNEAVKDLHPENDFGAIQLHFLIDTPDHQLCVAWLREVLDEDEHHADEFAESFFILEGSCECNIGGQLINLKAGDYLDIPFDTHHTIRSTSPGHGFVKAILQRKKLAA